MNNITISNPQSYRFLPDDSASLAARGNVVPINALPDLIIQHIASKLTLPDLLSFIQTCHHVYSSIGERIISQAKDKSYYKFKYLRQIPKHEHDQLCKELTSLFNGALHSQAGNINVVHKGEMCIKSEELEVVNIDAVNNLQNINLGTLSNGKKFAFIDGGFFDRKDDPKNLLLKRGYQEIYAGNSYREIIQLIQDRRSDALPKHATRLLSHEKIYY